MSNVNKKILILASGNKGKIKEFQDALGESFIVKSMGEVGLTEDIPETGTTFKENAEQKVTALYNFCTANNVPFDFLLADDSGFLVDALPGHLGVYTKRDELFGGENTSDFIKNEMLITIMKNKENRNCKYVASLCICTKTDLRHFEGTVEGFVGEKQIGDNGFAWDTIFYIEENKSIACLTTEEKLKISHRGKALAQVLDYIKSQEIKAF